MMVGGPQGAMQMSGLSRRNAAEGTSRSRGHSAGRRSMPIRALAVVAAVVVGAAACGTSSPSASTTVPSTGPAAGGPSPVSSASTSSRGVTQHSINVVFPVVALNSLAGQEGFAEDAEFGEQAKAINLFVKQINDDGGINGRKINAILTSFDPTNETQMRALCKTWTEGSPAAFAVLDGLGDWTGDDQLCITQEGHTPFIGAWSTVTNWTNEGSPYLWWTGPDQATVLQAVVNWGLSAHLLGGAVKVGIIAGDRASDQNALDDYLLPDLRNAGVTPVVKTIDSNPDDTATTDAEAPLVVQQLRSAGITSIIPLMPFNVFYPVLQAETSQQWYPKPPVERLRGEHRILARIAPHSLRQGPQRTGGGDHRDLGRHRQPPPPEPGRVRPRRPQVLERVAQGLSAGATGKHERPDRGAGTHRRVVPGHRPLRHGGEERRGRPQPAHLRHRHVQDHQLPGHVVHRPQLRAQQALRPHEVPGGQVAGQLAALVIVQDDAGQTSGRHLLGVGPAFRAAAHRLIGPGTSPARPFAVSRRRS